MCVCVSVCVIIRDDETCEGCACFIIYKQNKNLQRSCDTLAQLDTNVKTTKTIEHSCVLPRCLSSFVASTPPRKDTGVFESFGRFYFCDLVG